MDKRMEARATTPRYTVTRAAELVGRPPNTIRRWSLGHQRMYKGQPTHDDPLIEVDGRPALPLSFLNLLELQLLSHYRNEAALQAIRRALVFVAKELRIPRPLISIEFKVRGGELFTRFAETKEGAILINASRGGQMTLEKLVGGVKVTEDIDYDHDVVRRWWFKSRAIPLYVDTQVAGGRPITADTGVRLDAIATRHRDGYSNGEISEDTGATETEVVAAILAA
jgi:uncharacterized protein (DUF433 family)